MAKISISYRRSDSQDITGRIFDRLVGHYGRNTVFRDIDSIRPGADYRTQINDALMATDVVLVVIGPHWLGRAEGREGRIDNEADPVRIEVETALKRTIPVIPVLVGGAKIPEPRELPASLRDLAYRQAVAVDSGRDFEHHIEGLIEAIDLVAANDVEVQMQPDRRGGEGAPRGVEREQPTRRRAIVGPILLAGSVAAGIAVVAAFVWTGHRAEQSATVQAAIAPAAPVETTQRAAPAALAPSALAPSGSQVANQTAAAGPVQISVTPSYDCLKSGNDTEREICRVGELSLLDRELDVLYAGARRRLDGAGQKALLADENAWRAQRDACGTNDTCIRDAYRGRIAQLQVLH